MNFAPKLSTCSLAAGRTSVAVTMAPSRRAVAIACSPATPAPMTKIRAAGTVPAAVIIIGSARPSAEAPPPGVRIVGLEDDGQAQGYDPEDSDLTQGMVI